MERDAGPRLEPLPDLLHLTRIDGIDAPTALKVVAEIGLDMTRWPTEKNFASWLCLSPGSRITGGKKISGRTKPSASRAAAALRLAAVDAVVPAPRGVIGAGPAGSRAG